MKALLIVDMIHEFVDGKYGSEGAKKIVPKIKRAAEKFREEGIVIYLCDSHKKGDSELALWGEHAMEGTWGAEIVEELTPADKDLVIKKRTYDGFLSTPLEKILREKGIKEVFICGVATDICVKHTAFGAFARGFDVHILQDCCSGTSEEEHRRALDYMRRIYGAKLVECDEV